ncbi:MAG: SMI1/KNR4 family protein [Bacteroidetes bacterium]|nr:SMI1/KNR4 family protein [Bacteroidota bacterium]
MQQADSETMRTLKEYFGYKQKALESISDSEVVALEGRLKSALPDDYKDFLKKVNRFEGFVGNSYVRFAGVNEVDEFTRMYCAEFYPGKICIGTNGAGELFVLERTGEKNKYGVVPTIGDESDYIALGDTLEQFLERVYSGSFIIRE